MATTTVTKTIIKDGEEQTVTVTTIAQPAESDSDDESKPKPSVIVTDGSDESAAEQVTEEVLAKHKRAAKKKHYHPEIAMLDPKPRTFSNTSSINPAPCGGADRGFTHYMAMPGSRNYVQWKVAHPSPDGKCIVRIG